jgi:hypothetical protein
MFFCQVGRSLFTKINSLDEVYPTFSSIHHALIRSWVEQQRPTVTPPLPPRPSLKVAATGLGDIAAAPGYRLICRRRENVGRLVLTPDVSKVLRHSRRLINYGFSPDTVVSAVRTVIADLRSGDVPEQTLQPLVAFVARVERNMAAIGR